MAKAKKAARSKDTKVANSLVKKKITAIKKKAARAVVQKIAVAPTVKKNAENKPALKKLTRRTAVKMRETNSAVKIIAATRESQAASKERILRGVIADLKVELKGLKDDLKSATRREAAVSRLTSQRNAAVGKFLSGWDKKTRLALDKSLKPKKKKKSAK